MRDLPNTASSVNSTVILRDTTLVIISNCSGFQQMREFDKSVINSETFFMKPIFKTISGSGTSPNITNNDFTDRCSGESKVNLALGIQNGVRKSVLGRYKWIL